MKTRKTPIRTTHTGKAIWITPNGHKLAREPESGAFTLAQAKRYDIYHTTEIPK